MATLDWHVTTQGGTTLVRLLVTSEATERVRVTNCLDGPVWPPRREGVPEEGWNEDGFEGVVDADERLVLGYACPAEPCDPPARVTSLDPEDADAAVTAREIVRSLGDPSPPRDAVAGSAADASEDRPEVDSEVTSGAAAGLPSEEFDDRPGDSEPGIGSFDSHGSGDAGPDENWPTVEAWLTDVADRAEEAERLTGVSSVSEATAALTAVGDSEDVATLVERLETDRRRVETVARRCETLTARLEELEVPVETLARLA